MSRYKPSYHFVVTHSVPCPICKALKLEKELQTQKSRYLYGFGWLERSGECDACYAVRELEAEKEAADRLTL